jgi:hypothetical protein
MEKLLVYVYLLTPEVSCTGTGLTYFAFDNVLTQVST